MTVADLELAGPEAGTPTPNSIAVRVVSSNVSVFERTKLEGREGAKGAKGANVFRASKPTLEPNTMIRKGAAGRAHQRRHRRHRARLPRVLVVPS